MQMQNIEEVLASLLPNSVIKELCNLVLADSTKRFKDLNGQTREKLVKNNCINSFNNC